MTKRSERGVDRETGKTRREEEAESGEEGTEEKLGRQTGDSEKRGERGGEERGEVGRGKMTREGQARAEGRA